MEPEYSLSVFLGIIFSLLIFWLHMRLRRSWSSVSNIINLPPGPRKLPIIGNLHNLLAGSLPHHTLRNLSQKYGPLMHLKLGQVSAVVVSSPKMAREVLKANDLAVSGRPELLATKILTYNGSDIAFSPYGDYWRQMRKICILELLSLKRVKSFSCIREEEVSKLVESLRSSARSPVNLTEKIFTLTSIIIARAAFGSESEDQDAFLSMSKEAIRLSGGFELVDLFPSSKFLKAMSRTRAKLERIHKEKDRIMETIIQEHREKQKSIAKGGDIKAGEKLDLVDVLLQLQQSGTLEFPISNDNIKAVIWDMFTAGSDSSSTLMVWTMAEMIKSPRVMEKAQAEIREVFRGKKRIKETDIQKLSYLKLVIKEALRLHPPPLLLPRECREACKIDGYDIPMKTKVIINAWAIGRDPEYWKDAERFEPERFANSSINYNGTNFEYIPFGAGKRICPGISLGLMNVEFPLAQLLYHFDWNIPNETKPENLDMTETFGATVGMKNILCLIANPFIPSFED